LIKKLFVRAWIFILAVFYFIKFISRVKPYYLEDNLVDVCMTSHGKRIYFMPIAIEALMSGSIRPNRFFVTLDLTENMTYLKAFLVSRLSNLGITIIYGDSLGPHCKYIHYINSHWSTERSFAVFDDDAIYRADILEALVNEAASYPDFNICMRSQIIELTTDKFAPYNSWAFNTVIRSSIKIFATGVGGVLVCPKFAAVVKKLDKKFQDSCPKQDDVWFNWISVFYGIPYRQCRSEFYTPDIIPFSQGLALHKTNRAGQNDIQIKNTYCSLSIRKLNEVVL